MNDRVELLESVLCALAFDLGRSRNVVLSPDGLDFDRMVNLHLLSIGDFLTRQALALEHVAAIMAGLTSAMVENGLVHPDSIKTKRTGPGESDE